MGFESCDEERRKKERGGKGRKEGVLMRSGEAPPFL